MPIYEYRCPNCATFEVILRMGTAADCMDCPQCQSSSSRRVSAPSLSQTGSSAFKLIDSANRSAHEPSVVSTPRPGARVGRTQPVTSNPLHYKLPRP
jgi:putative FmdB family regulatory protein